MTYAAQPSPPTFEPDIHVTGDLSAPLLWVAVVLLAIAMVFIFRAGRASNGE